PRGRALDLGPGRPAARRRARRRGLGLTQDDDRRAMAAALRRRVEELGDVGAGGEQLPDLGAARAGPLAVDQAHLAPARGARFPEVLVDDGRDVARREGMEVERVLDRDPFQTAGLSVVAFSMAEAATGTDAPQTHVAAKLPSGATDAFGTSSILPSLTLRS